MNGGAGGNGASLTALDLGVSSFGNLTIHGGDGGGGGDGFAMYGTGGAGGLGGALYATANVDINVSKDFQLGGGSGGSGGKDSSGAGAGGGAGGEGGVASLSLATKTMTVDGNFTMANGQNGTNANAGMGGGAIFEAGRLLASNITLTRNANNTNFLFRVNEIGVKQNGITTLRLNNTSPGGADAASGVFVGGLSFAGNSTLKVTTAYGGNMQAQGNLYVAGSGNKYEAPYSLAFNAQTGQLTFALDGVEANQTMLYAQSTQVKVGTGSKITLTSKQDQLLVYEGDEFILLDGAEGNISPYQPTQIVQGPLVNRYLAVSLLADKLLATVTGMQSVESAIADRVSNNKNVVIWSKMGDAILRAPSPYVSNKNKLSYEQYQAILLNFRNQSLNTRSYGQGQAGYAASNLELVKNSNKFLFQDPEKKFFKFGSVGYMSARGVPEYLESYTATPSLVLPCDAMEPAWKSRLWSSASGSWARQDERDGISGYKYQSRGAVLGYDYQFGNSTLGLAAAYSHGKLDNEDLRQHATADIFNFGLFGRYEHPTNGFFANAALAYGHAWNRYDVNMYVGGVKEANYQSADLTATAEFGKRFRLPHQANLLASAGLTYDHLYSQGYAETYRGDNPHVIPNTIDGLHDNSLAIPLTVRVNRLFPFGCNGGFVVPEARATYTYQAVRAAPYATVGLVGYPGYTARIEGVDPGRSRFHVGAGLSGQFNRRVGFAVNYDAEFSTGFVNQAVSAQIRINF